MHGGNCNIVVLFVAEQLGHCVIVESKLRAVGGHRKIIEPTRVNFEYKFVSSMKHRLSRDQLHEH